MYHDDLPHLILYIHCQFSVHKLMRYFTYIYIVNGMGFYSQSRTSTYVGCIRALTLGCLGVSSSGSNASILSKILREEKKVATGEGLTTPIIIILGHGLF